MAQRQIVNGGFQSASGAPLDSGYVTFRLNTDMVSGTSQISAEVIVKVPLDANGNVLGTVSLWTNDGNPATVYITRAYTAQGQLVWEGELIIPTGVGSYSLSGTAETVCFFLTESGGFLLLESGGRIQLESCGGGGGGF